MHDTNAYSNPFEFDPTRFLPEDGRAPAPDPRDYCFGFGRRCVVLLESTSSSY